MDRRERLVVVILTLNEEVNLPKALRSVLDRAPVIVVDSKSSDRTREIAERMGAEFVVRPFDGYAKQRNFALDLAKDRFHWVFFLDADEEVPPEVWADIDEFVSRDDADGIYFGRTVRMLGHELRHGGIGKHSALRLMRPELARFDREINERVDESRMRIASARAKVVHDDHKGLGEWFHKHIRYAQREAESYLSGRADSLDGFGLGSQRARTIGLRWAYNRLPLGLRPFANFARTLVWLSGWRDGVPGVMYAAMQSLWYPMLIDLLIYDAKRSDPHGGSADSRAR